MQTVDLDVAPRNVELLFVLDDSVRAGGKGPCVRFDARAVRVVFKLSRSEVSSGYLVVSLQRRTHKLLVATCFIQSRGELISCAAKQGFRQDSKRT